MSDLPIPLNRRHNRLNSLPQEITLNIFSRLPASSVLDCKQVCKSWRNLLQLHDKTTYFASQHLQQQHGMSFVIFDKDCQSLYHAEYHDGVPKNLPIYHSRRINHKFPAYMLSLVGSCNGLLCFSTWTDYYGISITKNNWYNKHIHPKEPSFICNPITREFVKLPSICIGKNKSGIEIVCGFGYHPLTNEYKVVRIVYFGLPNKLPPNRGLVQVYTLGSGSGWRSLREINIFLRYNPESTSVCSNGFLYWLCQVPAKVVAFDLADEQFYFVPNPPGPLNKISRLCVLRSCLYLITVSEMSSLNYDLWLLKENKEADEKPSKSVSWSKEFTMEFKVKGRKTLYRLFALTKGSEFLFVVDKDIIRQNSNTKRNKRVWVLEGNRIPEVLPVSHINSFVSLKALGEKKWRHL